MKEQSKFWTQYKRLIIKAYLGVSLGFIIAMPIGYFVGRRASEIVAVVGFLISAYYFSYYRLTDCPHCKRHPQNFRNLIYPIDPTCKSCGKNMSEEVISDNV